jgi:DNA-directed RNA polymerase subunit RPC12/RpoP
MGALFMADFYCFCPNCNQKLSFDETMSGQTFACPSCSHAITMPSTPAPKSAPMPIYTPKTNLGVKIKEGSTNRQELKQYKVLTQKDKWFSGKFDPERLEQAINAYAKQGWRVVSCATASIYGIMSSHREEFIVILERDV